MTGSLTSTTTFAPRAHRAFFAMNITINHTSYPLPDGATVLDALTAIAAKPPFAVAVNTTFVPSAEHARHLLQDGDSVEVISPVTGG